MIGLNLLLIIFGSFIIPSLCVGLYSEQVRIFFSYNAEFRLHIIPDVSSNGRCIFYWTHKELRWTVLQRFPGIWIIHEVKGLPLHYTSMIGWSFSSTLHNNLLLIYVSGSQSMRPNRTWAKTIITMKKNGNVCLHFIIQATHSHPSFGENIISSGVFWQKLSPNSLKCYGNKLF